MLGTIIVPINVSMVNAVLPVIMDWFGARFSEAQWVLMGYLLVVCSLLILFGRLGDILGYKRIYINGLIGFVISSTLCAFSPTIHSLILFRVIQGISAAMIMSVSFAIITSVFKRKERGTALGINATSIAIGLMLGSSMGGLITAYIGWRYIFLVNIPLSIVGIYWAKKVIPEYKSRKEEKIDVLGASLFTLFLTSTLLLLQGKNFMAPLIPVLAFLFIYAEKKSRNPIISFELFLNRTFSFGITGTLLTYCSFYMVVFLTPFYLMKVLGLKPDIVGMIMATPAAIMLFVAPFSGIISDKIGTRLPTTLGALICLFSFFMMSLLSPSSAPKDVVLWLAMCGLGNSIFQTPNNSAVMGSVSKIYLGLASGTLSTMRNVGMLLGIAIAGFVLYSLVPPAILHTHGIFSVTEVEHFMEGFKYSLLIGVLFSGLTSLLSITIKNGRGGI